MGCCKLPDDVENKLNGVKKKLRMKKLSKVIRVAGELSRNKWDQEAVVRKLYPEFNRVEKQGHKTKMNLHKIAEAVTRELKGLNYVFPPLEKFCSEHMWFAKDAGGQSSTQQKMSEPVVEMPPAPTMLTRSPTREKVNMTAQIRTHDIPKELSTIRRPSSIGGSSSSKLKRPMKNSKGKEKAQVKKDSTQTGPRTYTSKQGRVLMHAKDYKKLFFPRP